ncbi:MAG TPA: M23 family metallopeptidase [Candidatus Lokiarchaeia archaeon]|nr:M23 family metallopeptidase [Candidatus Lokiarchaeia archaeon]
MKRKVKIALTVIIISCATLSVGLMAYISYMGLGCIIPEDCPPLEFPIAGGAQNITDFNGFNITNWGAPGSYHNGMDLVTTGHNWTSIVAAAPGQVIAISETPNPNSNPPGATMFGISVRVGCRWVVIYNMEPVAYLESQRALQRQEIYVKVGDQVTQGETIARLLCTNMTYNHLHFMLQNSNVIDCAYYFSSPAAKAIYDQLAQTFNKTVCCMGSNQPGCLSP